MSKIDCPHPPQIIDESSGIEVSNKLYNAWQEGFNAGRQEGIREVVEWIEHKARHDSWGNTLQELTIDKQLIIDVPLWQIKLNEWGIER